MEIPSTMTLKTVRMENFHPRIITDSTTRIPLMILYGQPTSKVIPALSQAHVITEAIPDNPPEVISWEKINPRQKKVYSSRVKKIRI